MEKGKCRVCGDTLSSKQYCEKHRLANNERARRYMARKRVKKALKPQT